MDQEHDLRSAIASLPPGARDKLRRILVMDQADRDEVAQELLRFRDEASDALTDLIDTLTMYPEERRRAVRMIAEVEASG